MRRFTRRFLEGAPPWVAAAVGSLCAGQASAQIAGDWVGMGGMFGSSMGTSLVTVGVVLVGGLAIVALAGIIWRSRGGNRVDERHSKRGPTSEVWTAEERRMRLHH